MKALSIHQPWPSDIGVMAIQHGYSMAFAAAIQQQQEILAHKGQQGLYNVSEEIQQKIKVIHG